MSTQQQTLQRLQQQQQEQQATHAKDVKGGKSVVAVRPRKFERNDSGRIGDFDE